MSNDTQPLRQPPASQQEWAWAIFAYLLLLGFFGLIFLSYFVASKLPGDTLGVVIGYIGGWISAVVMFRWGTSLGSERKNATIEKLSNGKIP